MAYSRQRAVSDGTLTQLGVSLQFIARADLSVLLDGVLTTDWEWLGMMDTIVFPAPIPNGVEVSIVRATQSDKIIHVFAQGAKFVNTSVDQDFLQVLYLAQEYTEGSGFSDVFNDLDMHGFKLTNLGAGTNPSDAVNLAQLQEVASDSAAALRADLLTSSGAGMVGYKSSTVSALLDTFDLPPEHFGAVGDKVTDDSVAIGLWLTAAAGRPGVLTSGKLYRITQSLSSLYAGEIRVVGKHNCWSPKNMALVPGQWYSGFFLDGANVSLAGFWDTATNTLTFPERVKMICDMVVGTSNARYGMVEHLTNAIVSGVHFQGFLDHGLVTVGAVFLKLHDISMYNCGLSKGVSGNFYGGTFINGCGWHAIGYAPSGVSGNYLTCRNWTLGNYSSTVDVSNIYIDTVFTQSTSCKGAIICNMRSTAIKNFGTYSGVYIEYSELSFDSGHLETYATGGDVPGNGFPQSLVIFDARVQTSNMHQVHPTLFMRTPYTSSSDYWGFDLNTANKREFSRFGFSEMVLGTSQDDNPDLPPQHYVGTGSANHPVIHWDKQVNALRGTKGGSFPVIVGMPINNSGELLASTFADLNSTFVVPPVDTGSGNGGIYDLDVQVFDPNNGALYYHATVVAFRQIADMPDKYKVRYYVLGGLANNPPVGGFSVAEVDLGAYYTLRISNGTLFNYGYTVTSRLRTGLLPQAM